MRQRVVIVDDHPGFLSWARRFLADEGYDVVGEAVDGVSALSVVNEIRPQLVLVDIQLPDIDGLEVARRLLCLDDPPIVVLISSRDASDYGSRLRETGARGFLSKAELSGAAIDRLMGS